MSRLSADDLIYGYMNAVFPMADSNDARLYWYSPNFRAIIPLNTYRPAKSLRSILNKHLFELRINCEFEQVMRSCAVARTDDDTTWISEEIIEAYMELHHMGLAHSVETYIDNRLAGGLYGVALGAVFFGESMFYLVPNASKIAFHYLIEILRKQGFVLLDTQFINDNVRRFGAIEIPRLVYTRILKKALYKKVQFVEPVLEHLGKDHL